MMMRRSVIKPFRRGRMSVALVNSHHRARNLFERGAGAIRASAGRYMGGGVGSGGEGKVGGRGGKACCC